MGIEETEQKRQDRLLRNVLFTFFVSGAASQSLGALLPVMRESYGFSYDFQGLLLSCQSVGNLAAVLLTGFLPAYLGRRRTILSTAGWMAAGYLIFTCGTGAPAFLLAACVMMGVARGSNANFSNTVVSTLPAESPPGASTCSTGPLPWARCCPRCCWCSVPSGGAGGG